MQIAKHNRDMYVYHPELAPKIIKAQELGDYIKQGWQDNPSPFIKYEDVGIDRAKIDERDTKEMLRAEQTLMIVAAIATRLNDQINLHLMKKAELKEFAKTHLKIELKGDLKKVQMLNKIRGILGGNS
jgi:hypothetical protein